MRPGQQGDQRTDAGTEAEERVPLQPQLVGTIQPRCPTIQSVIDTAMTSQKSRWQPAHTRRRRPMTTRTTVAEAMRLALPKSDSASGRP